MVVFLDFVYFGVGGAVFWFVGCGIYYKEEDEDGNDGNYRDENSVFVKAFHDEDILLSLSRFFKRMLLL